MDTKDRAEMAARTGTLRSILAAEGGLAEADLQRSEDASQQTGTTLLDVVLRLGLITDEALAGALARGLSLPLIAAADLPRQNPVGDGVSHAFLAEERCVPVSVADDRLVVAMVDPTKEFAATSLAAATGMPVDLAVIALGDAEVALDRFAQQGDATASPTDVETALDGSEDDINRRLIDQAREAPVIRVVNTLLSRAVNSGASDIHIEPYESALVARLRVDGVLYDQPPLARRLAPAVVSRLKLMAGLDISERRLAQDGRIRTVIAGRDLDLRVSTLPTLHGEAVVIRLLRQDMEQPDLSHLGMSEATQARMREIQTSRHGIFLSTGATGSGKTTTLYAVLRETDSEAEKIVTVEDPVEYQLDRITQVQVKPDIGLTFSRVLRSVVRQDPDVIMIGETRDLETAEIAVQAALTGHLVYSTLHTNDAATAISRLIDMGIDDYLLASTLNGVVGQRLVRTLCNECKAPYDPPSELVSRFGLKGRLKDGQLYEPVGCRHCQNRGYIGRTGLFELMVVDDALRRLILDRRPAAEIEAHAVRAGMVTMFEDGVTKALAGITSLQEVTRVTRMH